MRPASRSVDQSVSTSQPPGEGDPSADQLIGRPGSQLHPCPGHHPGPIARVATAQAPPLRTSHRSPSSSTTTVIHVRMTSK